MSSLKVRQILLCLLLFPVMGNAEDNDAPAKFYDGLQIKVKKQGVAKIDPHQDPLDQSAPLEQELKLTTATPTYKSVSLKKSVHNRASSSDSSDDHETYIVGKNESLSVIALRFSVAPELLAAWNGITSPNQVYTGQKLKIFKNKQKHSHLKFSKKLPKIAKNMRDNPQKTSIISINNKSMLKFYCQWPTQGKVLKNFSQTIGRGIEISGKLGQAIKATAAGKVVAVSPGIYGHGSFIVIQHHNHYLSSYTNNRRSLVKNEQKVKQGQMIAEMGKIGRKPPSLEFEIRKNGKLVDPMGCLLKKI